MSAAEKLKELFTDQIKALGHLNIISRLLKMQPKISNNYRVYTFDLATARVGVNLREQVDNTDTTAGAVEVWKEFDRNPASNVSVTSLSSGATCTMSINDGDFFTIDSTTAIINEVIKRIVINNSAQADKTLEIRVDGLV